MKNNDRRKQPVLRTAAAVRSLRHSTLSLLVLVTGLWPHLATAVVESAAEEAGGSLVSGLMIAVGTLALAALVVMAVTRWSNKRDHMNEMVSFCMRYLIDSDRVSEGCDAATALGQARDPRAILVLVDVIIDQQADQAVRKAAVDALSAMSTGYPKYKKVVAKLKSASEQQDYSRLIAIVTLNFEKSVGGYVQSAYVIGRAYLMQGHYADAKEWFRIAETRNKATLFYGGQIRRLIADSNQRLVAKGDELFDSGKYHQARERYSAASHGMSDEESLPYSGFLRLACAYCKLGDYDDADQAVLLALKKGQETDMSLALNKLLQQLPDQDHPGPAEPHERIVSEIDDLATETMEKLRVQTNDKTS